MIILLHRTHSHPLTVHVCASCLHILGAIKCLMNGHVIEINKPLPVALLRYYSLWPFPLSLSYFSIIISFMVTNPTESFEWFQPIGRNYAGLTTTFAWKSGHLSSRSWCIYILHNLQWFLWKKCRPCTHCKSFLHLLLHLPDVGFPFTDFNPVHFIHLSPPVL